MKACRIGTRCRDVDITPGGTAVSIAGGAGGLPPAVIAHGCAAVAVAVGPALGAGQSWAATQSADPLYLARQSKNCRNARGGLTPAPIKVSDSITIDLNIFN